MNESLTPDLGLDDLRWLHRLARQLVQDPVDAEDAVQETVLAALSRAPGSVRAPRGWLSTVLHNVVRQGRRGEARRAARERKVAVQEKARSAAEVVEELAWHRTLVDQVHALAEPYRTTIVLRFLRDRSPSDIAREQDIPVKTVHTRIARGLTQLRQALDRTHDGDRHAWVPAIAALGAPVGNGIETGNLVIGGLAVGTLAKVSAAAIAAAVVVYIATRSSPEDSTRSESPSGTPVESAAADASRTGAADGTMAEPPDALPVQRQRVEEALPIGVPSVAGTNVLRVILEGISEEDARAATIRLTSADEPGEWPAELRPSWPCQGSTSEFDLDPFFAKVERHGRPRVDELRIAVDHSDYFLETARFSRSSGVEGTSGRTVHEVRVPMVPPAYWPELTLSVRDARTREHLNDVELSTVSPAFMGTPRQPGTPGIFTPLGDGFRSPIVLQAGREGDDPEQRIAGVAMRPVASEASRLFEFFANGRVRPDRGLIVYARAPGYAWGSIALDVSKGEDREILLGPGAALDLRLTHVLLERYAALEMDVWLNVWQAWPNGDRSVVLTQRLNETLEREGLRIEGIEPGELIVEVKLGGVFSPGDVPMLGREELTLRAGEARELVLALAEPPAPPERSTLAGVVSIPTFGGEETVRLQIYSERSTHRNPEVELTLAELEPSGGALPTWSFRVDDMTVGLYRVQLLPFVKAVMVELPAEGREDIELVVRELAEVQVETVDGRTGERVPLDEFYYRHLEPPAGLERHDWAQADTEEPGRFHFWTVPGAVSIYPRSQDEWGYGLRWEEHRLVAGFQSLRFELPPLHGMHFEFREDGSTLPVGDPGMFVTKNIRAVGHDGRVTGDGLQTSMVVEVSAPGVYELHFDGIDTQRYHPLPPRQVEVREGEVVKVVVELRLR